jgi:hypothetical protein
MPIARWLLLGRAVLLSVIVTFTAPALLQLLPNSQHATAEATVALADSDDQEQGEREGEAGKGRE